MITHRVAVPVIDRLKMIDIHNQKSAAKAGLIKCFRYVLTDGSGIINTGQSVVLCLLKQSVFFDFLLLDIPYTAD